MPSSRRVASSASLAADSRAQFPISLAVAVTRKCGDGRKKVVDCAAARRSMLLGEAAPMQSRRTVHVEEKFV